MKIGSEAIAERLEAVLPCVIHHNQCAYVKDMTINHKNYNFLACDWFKNVLFSTNSLAKLLSNSLLLDTLLLDSLLLDSLISQSHSKT